MLILPISNTKIIGLYLLLLSTLSFSQNKTYALVDSIFKLMNPKDEVNKNVNYRMGLTIWKEADKSHLIDPELKTQLLYYTWDMQDFTSFKETLIDLIRNFGFTLEDLEKRKQIYDELMGKPALADWLKSVYDKNHKLYMTENAGQLQLIQKCKDYYFIHDKVISDVFMNMDSRHLNNPTFIANVDTLKQKLLWNLLVDIFELCTKNNYLPTNFDCKSTGVSSNLLYILNQNMVFKYKLEEKWLLMRPYLERACLDGKINPLNYLYLYDQYCYGTNGYQYYGTLNNPYLNPPKLVPIKDEAQVNERRAKYGVAKMFKR